MTQPGLFGTALAALVAVADAAEALAVTRCGALPLIRQGAAVPAPPFALDASSPRSPEPGTAQAPIRPAAVLVLGETGGDATLGHLCLRRAGSPAGAECAASAGADGLLLDAGSDGATLALLAALLAARPPALAFLPIAAALTGAAAAQGALADGAAGLAIPFGTLADESLRAALLTRAPRRDSGRAKREAAALRANLRRRKLSTDQ